MAQTALQSGKLTTFREQRKRFRRAQISADIEGLARNPETEEMRKRWMVEGLPVAEQIECLKTYYAKTE